MPHCVILYTPNLDRKTDLSKLCRKLADTMIQQVDESGKQIFPTGGTRVLAFPAAHCAVADGGAAGLAAASAKGWSEKEAGDYAFIYLNIRMAAGRSEAAKKRAGDALTAVVKAHFDDMLLSSPLGITLQIDESPGQVYDAKISSLHPLFQA
jgi:5-carboxymethyl-2-hydroxymuconate isomerase